MIGKKHLNWKLISIGIVIVYMTTLILSCTNDSLNITVEPTYAGSVSRESGGGFISLLVASNKGYRFDHWDGDFSGSISPINIPVGEVKNIY